MASEWDLVYKLDQTKDELYAAIDITKTLKAYHDYNSISGLTSRPGNLQARVVEHRQELSSLVGALLTEPTRELEDMDRKGVRDE